jgi:hypothetical protein
LTATSSPYDLCRSLTSIKTHASSMLARQTVFCHVALVKHCCKRSSSVFRHCQPHTAASENSLANEMSFIHFTVVSEVFTLTLFIA